MKKIFICSVIFVLFALVVSTSVSENFANAGFLENSTVNVTIRLTPDARREITVHAEIPITGVSEDIGLLSSANIQVDISSPDSRSLQMTGNASVTLTQPVSQDLDVQLAQIALTYSMMPSVVNSNLQQILVSFMENLGDEFLGLADLQLENASVTSFNWQSPTLSAGVSMTFSGTIFDNQQLRDELPITLRGDINVSSTTVSLRLDGNSRNYNGWVEIVAALDTLTIDGFISSPLSMIGENVETSIGTNLPFNIGDLLEGTDTTVTLIVPEGANIEDTMPGFTQEGSSYTWKNDNGASLIMDIAAGQPLADVSYKYVPPSSYTLLIVATLLAIIVPIAIAAVILKRRR
jgi:hypothetical protein